MTYLEMIIKVLEELGGTGSLKDIYQECRQLNSKSKDPSIRYCIEAHSSDSDNFQGKKDVFYSVYGKGKGFWGLRELAINITNEEFENEYSAFEGKQNAIIHLERERNSKIVKLAKDKFKKEHGGRVFCEIPNCSFDFSSIYGERGIGFIEAHHIKPISERDGNEETTVYDFLMVCSNCHRMIHRKPYLADNELQTLIKDCGN